ncbi:MAG TPA: hypothetical protein PKA37_03830 [Planctomycetota bacterium]|nr:hypothetical protein [Planctomycetota bacterium]
MSEIENGDEAGALAPNTDGNRSLAPAVVLVTALLAIGLMVALYPVFDLEGRIKEPLRDFAALSIQLDLIKGKLDEVHKSMTVVNRQLDALLVDLRALTKQPDGVKPLGR